MQHLLLLPALFPASMAEACNGITISCLSACVRAAEGLEAIVRGIVKLKNQIKHISKLHLH